MIEQFENENLLDPNRTINYQEIMAYLQSSLRNVKCVGGLYDVGYCDTMPKEAFQKRTTELLTHAKNMDVGQTICTPFNIGGYHWTLVTLTKGSDGKIHSLFMDSNENSMSKTLSEKFNQAWTKAVTETSIGLTFGFVGGKVQKAVTYINGGNGSDNHCGGWICAMAAHIDQAMGSHSNRSIKQEMQNFFAEAEKFDIEGVRAKMLANLLVPQA